MTVLYASSPPTLETGASCRVLLVEDSPTQAKQIALILRSLGFEVQHVTSAAEALVSLSAHPVDVVLLDLILPDAEELEALDAIAGQTPATPIVVLTSLDDRQLAIDAVKRGAQDFLVKGRFEPELLDRTVRYAIERQRIANQLEALAAELATKNAELARLNEQKNHMIGVIAHDLRNPLSVINIYGQLLLRKAGSLSAAQIEYVQSILDTSAFMRRLVDDVLDIAKIEAGKLQLDPAPTILASLIDANVRLNLAVAEDKGISLRVTTEPVPPLQLDALKLEQVLSNLLQNAVKFSEPGTTVDVHLGVERGEAILRVADHGVGMPPEYLQRLFQPFGVPSREGTRGERGSGLGLAIARKIVEGHGGRLWAESAEGRGATFYVALPLSLQVVEG